MTLPFYVLAMFQAVRSETVKTADQDKWRIISLLPAWFLNIAWYWWLIAGLALTVLLALEGTYRQYRREMKAAADTHASAVAILQESLTTARERIAGLELALEQAKNPISDRIRPTPRIRPLNAGVERLTFDPHSQRFVTEEQWHAEHIPESILVSADVALIQFYYEPEENCEPFLGVSAHLTVETTAVKAEVRDAVWRRSNQREETFAAGQNHWLIVALIGSVTDDAISDSIQLYEYQEQKMGDRYVFSPRRRALHGSGFIISVHLVAKAAGEIRRLAEERLTYELTLRPEPKLMRMDKA